MKATKSANIHMTVYEGNFEQYYECVGVEKCSFSLCHTMPPDGSEPCTFNDHNTCVCSDAKEATLRTLLRRITRELKQLELEAE